LTFIISPCCVVSETQAKADEQKKQAAFKIKPDFEQEQSTENIKVTLYRSNNVLSK